PSAGSTWAGVPATTGPGVAAPGVTPLVAAPGRPASSPGPRIAKSTAPAAHTTSAANPSTSPQAISQGVRRRGAAAGVGAITVAGAGAAPAGAAAGRAALTVGGGASVTTITRNRVLPTPSLSPTFRLAAWLAARRWPFTKVPLLE